VTETLRSCLGEPPSGARGDRRSRRNWICPIVEQLQDRLHAGRGADRTGAGLSTPGELQGADHQCEQGECVGSSSLDVRRVETRRDVVDDAISSSGQPPAHRRAVLVGTAGASDQSSFPIAFPRAPSSSSHAGLRPLRPGLENRCPPFGGPWVRIPPPPLGNGAGVRVCLASW
jgi:hypothetical protein